jgi:hypothetical protein
MPAPPRAPSLKALPQDWLLAAAILAGSAVWLLPTTGAAGGGARVAKISRGGAVLAELPLDRREKRTFDFGSGRMTIETEPGRGVHILESNCPAKVCVHTGWASAPGENIACLPNKVLVEVEGEDPQYDAVIR